MKNIALIGFMGTGKTSVGKILGKRLGWTVVDVDLYIEEAEKRRISRIFQEEGEAYFRSLEKQAIGEICKRQDLVITTGGGAVIEPENLECLKRSSWVIGLFATPRTIFKRIRNSRHRPLLDGKDKLGEIEKLLAIRRPFYEKAELRFETDGRSSAQVAGVILEALKGKL